MSSLKVAILLMGGLMILKTERAIPERIHVSSPDLIGYMDRKYSTEQAPDGQVRIILSFAGLLDEVRLGKAVKLTFDAEPVLGCRLVERPLRLYWQRCINLKEAFEFHRIDPSEADRGIEDFLLAPMDPYKGPQVNVALYRSDVDTVYIKMTHIVADGGASMEYLRLLAEIYRSLADDPEYRPVSNLEGSRSSFQVLSHVGMKKVVSACAKISLPRTAWSFPDAGEGAASPAFFVRRVSGEHLSRIKAYAKARGATVGDILMTAYYRVLFELANPQEDMPLPLLVPVDLRRYLPTGSRTEGLCSLSAGYFPAISRKKGEAFDDTLARVRAAMERNKAEHQELGQLFMMEVAFAPGYIVPRLVGRYLASTLVIPVFSNIGVIDPDIADFGVKLREILPAGSMSTPPNFVMGSGTFNGEMSLTTIVCGTEAYKARVSSFFEALVRELPEYRESVVATAIAPGIAEIETSRPGQEHVTPGVREKSASDA